MTPKMLLLIDTDDGLDRELTKNLRQEPLDGEFFTKRISPDVTLDTPILIERCVSEVRELVAVGSVKACFVDIVILERGVVDRIGIDIAVELKRQIPALLVFCVTSKLTGKEERDLFSEATTLGLDGVFAKSFLGGDTFSARRLRTVLASADARRQEPLGDLVQLEPNTPQEVLDAFAARDLDPRVAVQIKDLGPGSFWTLLGMLFPKARGVIEYMLPGRSGSCVFRVRVKFHEEGKNPTRPKSWVLKVCKDANLVAKEVEGHHTVNKCPVKRIHIPRLLYDTAMNAGGLHGIVYEFEEGASTLVADLCMCKEAAHAEGLARQLSEVLVDLYGDQTMEIKPIWPEFALDESARERVLAFVGDCQENLSAWIDPSIPKQIADYVRGLDRELCGISDEVDQRELHGDLNCGNLLVGSDGIIRMIDFASRAKRNIVCDIAKLERDVVFRISDARSSRYHEWARAKQWRHFMHMINAPDIFAYSCDTADIEPNTLVLIRFIAAIRSSLKRLSPRVTAQQYLCGLLHYSLLAMLHPDISIAKKVFAIEYVDAIKGALAPIRDGA